jgi:hypothetical protein
MATRAAAVHTPGESPAPADQTAGAAPTMEELQAQIAAMGAAMQQLQANQRVIPAQAQAQSLPDMADIDLTEVNHGSTPVLTKQGWIVPPNFGADPVMLAEEKAKREERAALMKLAEVAAAKA